MKEKFYISILLVAFTLTALAQEHEDDKIKSLKTVYLTESLSLTSKEAEKFWPVYNAYEKQTDSLYSIKWCAVKNGIETIEHLEEETAEELLDEYISLKQTKADLKKEFYYKLKEIISSRKILMLKKAEHDFHKILLEKYSKHK